MSRPKNARSSSVQVVPRIASLVEYFVSFLPIARVESAASLITTKNKGVMICREIFICCASQKGYNCLYNRTKAFFNR